MSGKHDSDRGTKNIFQKKIIQIFFSKDSISFLGGKNIWEQQFWFFFFNHYFLFMYENVGKKIWYKEKHLLEENNSDLIFSKKKK